jgi:hypothetical protein
MSILRLNFFFLQNFEKLSFPLQSKEVLPVLYLQQVRYHHLHTQEAKTQN